MNYLSFTRLDGTLTVYLRSHIRWIELVDDQTLKIGMSSEMVTIYGRNLHLLAMGVVSRRKNTVTQTEERHLANPKTDIWVKAILTEPHKQLA